VDAVPNATDFVDTNARRILHRLFLGPEVPEPFATERELQRLVGTLVPRGRGWKWGQAIIEFGAIRCTARKPLCESCPLSDLCAARPTIWGALTSLPRAENATSRYEGWNRYYRGRVLAVLRETSEESTPLHKLGTILRKDFGDEDLSRLSGILESLEKDGLVKVSSTEDWPRAIAEERVAHRTERPEDPTYATTYVGLP
jgi:A/G-specific adenine glycosylase